MSYLSLTVAYVTFRSPFMWFLVVILMLVDVRGQYAFLFYFLLSAISSNFSTVSFARQSKLLSNTRFAVPHSFWMTPPLI